MTKQTFSDETPTDTLNSDASRVLSVFSLDPNRALNKSEITILLLHKYGEDVDVDEALKVLAKRKSVSYNDIEQRYRMVR